jgi:hypothetical protein
MSLAPKIPKLKGYIIFNTVTGEYGRKGGEFGKTPKIWADIGPLKNAINQFVVCRYGEWGYGAFGVYTKLDDRSKILIPKTKYENCVIIDVSTGEHYKMTPLQIAEKYAEEKQKKYKDYIIEYV